MKQYKRILVIFFIILAVFTLSSCNFTEKQETEKPKDKEQDTYVYLGEEVCFAEEIFFKVNNVTIMPNESTNEVYTLILNITVEQRVKGKYAKHIDITSDMFTIRNSKATSSIVLKSLFEAVVKGGAQFVIESSIEMITGENPDLLSLVEAISTSFLENISEEYAHDEELFKVTATKNQFEPFKPRECEEPVSFSVSFEIDAKHINNNSVLILQISNGSKNSWHFKRYITLLPRPQNNE